MSEEKLRELEPSVSSFSDPEGDDFEYVSKVIQYRGKRSNIRLEGLYWKILEAMAKERGCKINYLINDLISNEAASRNQTAFLRYSIVSWLNNRLYSASERLFLQNTEVQAILNATQLPGFIFSSTNSFSRFNDAFHTWLEENLRISANQVDLSQLRISFRRSFTAITKDLELGNGLLDNEAGAILIPGYVFPVSINLVILNNYSADGQVFLGLFNN